MKKKFTLFFSITIHLLLAVLYLPTAQGQVQSKPADKFVDMIGVGVHAARDFSQNSNSAANPNGEQNTINAISNLRIRHLRDGIYGWIGGVENFDKDNRGVITRFSAISQAGVNAGIPGGVDWIITDNTDDWQRLRDNYLVPLGNRVIVLEGANENMGVNGDAQAYQQIRNWWNNILPSLPNLKIATNTGPTAACEIVKAGSINDYVHFGNAHPYHFWPPFKDWGNQSHCGFNSTCAPPTVSLWTAPDYAGGTIGYIAATRTSRVAADKPMIFTEWGYPTIVNDANGWGVSELTAAKYMTRGFLEHFNAGIVYSCSYELMDPVPVTPFNADPEKHFGLAYSNGTLKPSGTAIKRLIALLEDGGNGNISTGALNYTLSGGSLGFTDDKNATTNEIHQTLLQKANGKFYLVLWQEAISTNSSGSALSIPAVNVTVNFGETLSGLKAYLPTITDNGSPVVNTANVSSYTFSVPDHPLVIEITTANYSVTGVSVSPLTPALNINQTLQLTATLIPANATNRIVSWSTSNAAIATVSTSGLVKGVAAGTADITVTTADGSFTAVSQITVTSVLPLQLISFTAKLENGKADLRWKTENEINVSHFDIERSSDGNRFDKIKELASGSNGNYGIVDAAPLKGYNYYRLKMVDKDGKFTYSNVEVIRSFTDAKFSVMMYPNPNNGLLVVEPSQSDKPITVSIFDQQGRLLVVKQITGKTPIDIHHLANGIYAVRFMNNEFKKTEKLIIE